MKGKPADVKKGVNLWREGKDGAVPGKRQKAPGGGEDFQAPANYRNQYEGAHITGGGGAHGHSSLDNLGVFANSIAGLGVDDKPFLPNPGSGRDQLDMYSVREGQNDSGFGLDMGKEPPRGKKI